MMYFSMHAFEQIERFWPIEELEDRVRDALNSPEEMIHLCEMIAILRNAAAERDGEPQTERMETVLEHISAETLAADIQEASAVISDGMRMELSKKGGRVDVTLAELDKRDHKHKFTYRKCAGYGLIAGISMADMRTMQPGMVVDMYLMRVQFEDEQHRIVRKKGGNDLWR